MDAREFGVAGLHAGFWRLADLEGAGPPGDELAAAIVVHECASWAVSLCKVVEPGDAALLQGLRWARNRGIHNLIDLTERGSGLVFPVTFPMSTLHYVWSPVEAIDRDDNELALGDEDGLAGYRAALAGRPVRDTISTAAELLGAPIRSR